MDNTQQQNLVTDFIKSTDAEDNYMIGSALTKQAIDFIGRDTFTEIYSTSKPSPSTHLSIGLASSFYNQNKALIKEWIERLVDKERRGATKEERMASILGMTKEGVSQVESMLDDTVAATDNDDKIAVILVDIVFGTIDDRFKAFSRTAEQSGYQAMQASKELSGQDYESFVGGTPSTMRHDCSMSGDAKDLINDIMTPMARIGDTNIFEVDELKLAALGGGELAGLLNTEDLSVLEAIKEDLIEL